MARRGKVERNSREREFGEDDEVLDPFKGARDQVSQLGIEATSSPRHSNKSPVPSSGFSF